METARRQIAEVEAELVVARDRARDRGRPDPGGAGARYQQALDELRDQDRAAAAQSRATSSRCARSSGLQVPRTAARARSTRRPQQSRRWRRGSQRLLPAQKASAEAALAQAQVELDKTLVRAGVAGTVQQFALRPGDVVNPMHAAGRHPRSAKAPGEARCIAGFGQIEAQVMKVGMIAEVTCVGQALHHHSDGGDRGAGLSSPPARSAADRAADRRRSRWRSRARLRSSGAALSQGGLDGVPPGSSCIANAYTNNHDALADPDIGTGRWLFLHVVDTVGLVHAMILRMQAMLLPVQTLVLSGH